MHEQLQLIFSIECNPFMAIAHDFSCSFSAGGLQKQSYCSCVTNLTMQFYECCYGKDYAVGADI